MNLASGKQRRSGCRWRLGPGEGRGERIWERQYVLPSNPELSQRELVVPTVQRSCKTTQIELIDGDRSERLDVGNAALYRVWKMIFLSCNETRRNGYDNGAEILHEDVAETAVRANAAGLHKEGQQKHDPHTLNTA